MSDMTPAPLPRTAILGVGSMGGAILSGLLQPDVNIELPVTVTTHSQVSAARYDTVNGVQAFAIESDPLANAHAVAGASIVLLGVKPHMIHDVLREVAQSLEPQTIVISVAAGITTQSMEALLPETVSVVRAMPNTPTQIGRGVTGVAGGSRAGKREIDIACRLCASTGEVVIVGEDRIDAVAAVSGSGPAYLFFFAEQFTEAARRQGFSEDEARVLAQGTIMGAAELMRESGQDPAELRRLVTSPNGTTERAIAQLQAGGVAELLDRAIAANIHRSQELAAGNKGVGGTSLGVSG